MNFPGEGFQKLKHNRQTSDRRTRTHYHADNNTLVTPARRLKRM